VRETEKPAADADTAGDGRRLAVQSQRWRAALLADHLDVPPAHALAPAGAEHLHHRLLGGEAGGVALEAPASARFAVRLLGRGEDTVAEAAAVPALQRPPDAPDLAQVGPDARDHRGVRQHAPQLWQVWVSQGGVWISPWALRRSARR
jgi:hypothetical protein